MAAVRHTTMESAELPDGNPAKRLGKKGVMLDPKMRKRERQSTHVAAEVLMRIEQQMPGRIYCFKVSTTKYKTTSTIVFDRGQPPAKRGDVFSAESDDDDDDDGEEAAVPKGPPPQPLPPKPLPSRSRNEEKEQVATKPKGVDAPAAGHAPGSSSPGAWQVQRKPAKQQPPPQKADRNAVSATEAARRAQQSVQDKARGGKAKATSTQPLEAAQVHSIAKSINVISKEVGGPFSPFMRKQVKIDGHQVTIDVEPTSVAAETIRQNLELFSGKIADMYRAGDGDGLREMLLPKSASMEAG